MESFCSSLNFKHLQISLILLINSWLLIDLVFKSIDCCSNENFKIEIKFDFSNKLPRSE